MQHRRLVRTAVVGVVAATSIGLAGGVAAAAPTTGSASLIPPGTSFSPPGLKKPSIDILVTTVRYDRVAGSVTASITLLGAPVRGFAGGPLYAVTLTGPGPLGSGPSASLAARGVPAAAGGSLAAASGATVTFPARVTTTGTTVVLTARDDRLKNQPFTRYEVTSDDAGNGSITSPLSADSVGGPLG